MTNMTTEPFGSKLIYEDLSSEEGEFKIELIQDLVYHDVHLGTVIVPKGFRSDLASIPKIVQNLISKVGPYDGAAVVHDWLYCVQTTTRAEADHIFLRIMKGSKVDYLTRYCVFWAVRLGAWLPWKISEKDISTYRRIMK